MIANWTQNTNFSVMDLNHSVNSDACNKRFGIAKQEQWFELVLEGVPSKLCEYIIPICSYLWIEGWRLFLYLERQVKDTSIHRSIRISRSRVHSYLQDRINLTKIVWRLFAQSLSLCLLRKHWKNILENIWNVHELINGTFTCAYYITMCYITWCYITLHYIT